MLASVLISGNQHSGSNSNNRQVDYLYKFVNITLYSLAPAYAPAPVLSLTIFNNGPSTPYGTGISNQPQLIQSGLYPAIALDQNTAMLNQAKMVTGAQLAFGARAGPTSANYIYAQACDAGSSSACGLYIDGSDADADFAFGSKGTGAIRGKIGSAEVFSITCARNCTGFGTMLLLQVGDGYIIMTPQSSAADVDMYLQSYGSGRLFLRVGDREGLQINNVPGSVNFFALQPGTTGQPAILYATGSDTNVDFRIGTQGTGVLQLEYASTVASAPGSFSAARYLPIKDISGTTYYVPLATATWLDAPASCSSERMKDLEDRVASLESQLTRLIYG